MSKKIKLHLQTSVIVSNKMCRKWEMFLKFIYVNWDCNKLCTKLSNTLIIICLNKADDNKRSLVICAFNVYCCFRVYGSLKIFKVLGIKYISYMNETLLKKIVNKQNISFFNYLRVRSILIFYLWIDMNISLW